MAKRLSRIERDIERLKEKISEYQQQLKELEAAKTEQENLQIIQLVRSMNMKPDEFAAFLRSGALNAAPTVTPYHKQEDAADETGVELPFCCRIAGYPALPLLVLHARFCKRH